MRHVRRVSIIVLLLLVVGPGRAHTESDDSIGSSIQSLADGWVYTWDEEPTGEPSKPDDLWKPFSFGDSPTDRGDRNTLRIRRNIDLTPWDSATLYLENILISGEVYLDDQRIYQTGSHQLTPQTKYRTSSWHLIRLPGHQTKDATLTIRYHSNLSAIGTEDDPKIGYESDLIEWILRDNLYQIVFGILFVFLGPASLVLYLKRREEEGSAYLSFGLFTTCTGIIFVLDGSGPGLTPYNAAMSYYLGHLAFFLFPIGLFAFVENAISSGPAHLMRWAWRFHSAFALLGLCLDVVGVIPLPLLKFWLLIIFVIDLPIALWVSIEAARGGRTDVRIVIAGMVTLILFGLFDVARANGIIVTDLELFHWGTFLFIGALGYSLERRFVENHHQLKRTNRDLVNEIEEREKAQNALSLAHQEVEQLKDRLASENVYLQEEIRLEHNFDEIIAGSDCVKEVLGQVEQVASTEATVLILGETGTGKELLARAIHNISPRRDRPMVKVNCAALPENLIESELFGHEKGAFTGALSLKVGRFELADESTIFLDEIGDLPLDLQSKLLRVLQEGEFERLGGTGTTQVDTRVIAATNRDLEKAIANGTFREDLYYRLNVFPIESPPLRDRKDDIPLLVRHFVAKSAAKTGKRVEAIPQRILDDLAAYHWPGNIRELENVVERAMIVSPPDKLKLGNWRPEPAAEGAIADTTLESVERTHILRILEGAGWRVRGDGGAAELLGMKPTTLESRMERLGIQRNA